MTPSERELVKQYARILNKAWTDSEFKNALLANPKQVLADEGMELPADIKVSITEGQELQSFDSAQNLLVLPFPPKPDEMLDGDGPGSGGGSCCCCCPCCSCCC
jgi:TOMM propeptide domain